MPFASSLKLETDALPVTTTFTGDCTAAAATGSLMLMEHPASRRADQSAAQFARRSKAGDAVTAAGCVVMGSPHGVAVRIGGMPVRWRGRSDALLERARTCRLRSESATT